MDSNFCTRQDLGTFFVAVPRSRQFDHFDLAFHPMGHKNLCFCPQLVDHYLWNCRGLSLKTTDLFRHLELSGRFLDRQMGLVDLLSRSGLCFGQSGQYLNRRMERVDHRRQPRRCSKWMGRHSNLEREFLGIRADLRTFK